MTWYKLSDLLQDFWKPHQVEQGRPLYGLCVNPGEEFPCYVVAKRCVMCRVLFRGLSVRPQYEDEEPRRGRCESCIAKMDAAYSGAVRQSETERTLKRVRRK